MTQPKDYKAIMLSSTFTDLKEHRERAIEAILRYNYMARVMEYSGANAKTDVIDTSLQMVQDAVAYVCVIGMKYGQTPKDAKRNADELSVTELEFNEAMRLGRPTLLLIMHDEHKLTKADIERGRNKQKKLDNFRERAKQMAGGGSAHRVYDTFKSLEEFSSNIAIAIGNLVRHLERSGIEERKSQALISVLPCFTGVPDRRATFVDRVKSLHQLDRVLNGDNARPGQAIGRVVVHGLGGVGKTSLAIEYAHRYRHSYGGVWWCSAETRLGFEANLAKLGAELGFVSFDRPQSELAVTGLRRLEQQLPKWLLIYDNVPNPEMISGLMPSRDVKVLITSRYPDWTEWAEEIELDVLSVDDAATLLRGRARLPDGSDAETLAKTLGCLPLALNHAAAYCKRTRSSFIDYAANAKNLIWSASTGAAHLHNVAATFALAISEAAEECPDVESVMAAFSLCRPSYIPIALLDKVVEDPARRERALAALFDASLFKYQSGSSGTVAEVHPLVMTVARDRANSNGTTAAVWKQMLSGSATRFPKLQFIGDDFESVISNLKEELNKTHDMLYHGSLDNGRRHFARRGEELPRVLVAEIEKAIGKIAESKEALFFLTGDPW